MFPRNYKVGGCKILIKQVLGNYTLRVYLESSIKVYFLVDQVRLLKFILVGALCLVSCRPHETENCSITILTFVHDFLCGKPFSSCIFIYTENRSIYNSDI